MEAQCKIHNALKIFRLVKIFLIGVMDIRMQLYIFK